MFSALALSDTVKNILTYARTFEHHYDIFFSNVRNDNISEDLQASNFLHNASLIACFCYVRITKSFIRCPATLSFVETEAAELFGITHLQVKSILSCDQADAVLLLRAAPQYYLNPNCPKGEIPSHPFYINERRYVNALHALFASIRDGNRDRLTHSRFNDFLRSQVSLRRRPLQQYWISFKLE